MQLELRNFPLDLFQRAQQHAAAVQRELDVLRVDPAASGRMPRRIDEVVADLHARFSGYRDTMDVLERLVQEGTEHADVVIPVLGDPEERAAAIEALADLLEEIDAYCESGEQLLTVVTPPDLRAFRSWLFREVLGQLRGTPPSPWSGTASTPDVASPEGTTGEATTVVREAGALDLGDAAKVRQDLQEAFTAGDGDVTLDLRAVTFVDSVILSVFVTAHKRFAEHGRHLSFVVPAELQRMFEITGLDDVLDVRPA